MRLPQKKLGSSIGGVVTEDRPLAVRLCQVLGVAQSLLLPLGDQERQGTISGGQVDLTPRLRQLEPPADKKDLVLELRNYRLGFSLAGLEEDGFPKDVHSLDVREVSQPALQNSSTTIDQQLANLEAALELCKLKYPDTKLPATAILDLFRKLGKIYSIFPDMGSPHNVKPSAAETAEQVSYIHFL